jgi:hypothetical protein
MLKRKHAIGGLSSIFKSFGGANGGNLINQLGGKGDLLSKVSSASGGLGNMLGGFQQDSSTGAIKGTLKGVASTAADSVIPGGGQIVGLTDTIGNAVGGKTGEFIKATNPIDSTVNTFDNLFAGDMAGLFESSAPGILAGALGIDFGMSRKDKAMQEMLKKKDALANKEYLKNNTAYNAKYGLAKKGMKFQEGGKLESFNTNNNVILKGVLHSQKNDLGDKGIPVMDCSTGSCEKVAEIEKEELVFIKDVTRQIDSYVMKYNRTKDKETRNQIATQLGQFVKQQLDKNTIDNTEKML